MLWIQILYQVILQDKNLYLDKQCTLNSINHCIRLAKVGQLRFYSQMASIKICIECITRSKKISNALWNLKLQTLIYFKEKIW